MPGAVRLVLSGGSLLTRIPSFSYHPRQAVLHLLRRRLHHPVSSFLDPLGPLFVAGRSVRRDMPVPVDLDHQVRLRARSRQHV